MPRCGRCWRRCFERNSEEFCEGELIEQARIAECQDRLGGSTFEEPGQVARILAAWELKEAVATLVVGKVWTNSPRWRHSHMRRVLEKVWNQALRVLVDQ